MEEQWCNEGECKTPKFKNKRKGTTTKGVQKRRWAASAKVAEVAATTSDQHSVHSMDGAEPAAQVGDQKYCNLYWQREQYIT